MTRGDGPIAPDLAVRPTDLTRLAAKRGGRFRFEEVLHSIDGRKATRGHGTAEMPAWGRILRYPPLTGGMKTTSSPSRSAVSKGA